MQRSSTPILYCLCIRPYVQQIVKTLHGDQMFRAASSKGGKGKGDNPFGKIMTSAPSSRSSQSSRSSRSSPSPSSSSTASMGSISSALNSKDNGLSFKTLSSGRLSDEQRFFQNRSRKDLQPRITREENMWRDPNQMDTKWLNPRDPTRYKPNFKNTEPDSLRKQFMRSPDERSRDVMGRDWENAVKAFRDNQRQNIYLQSTASTSSVKGAANNNKAQRKPVKIQQNRRNFTKDE
ncbi:uncharacterized protein [Drosophila tropicalis]|uniref:uncharacterized protein n=1 Tax=Drosophila tropicalis TaxID=46794 RepID=UPI0035ABF2A8